ncbi:MAG: O-antigen ligase family protein [Bacteroidota bacterium]
MNLVLSNPWSDIKFSLIKNFRSILVLTLPFLFIFVSLSYSTFLAEGLKAIEKYIPLLVFPLFLGSKAVNKNHFFFPRIFSLTILLICIICLSFGLYIFFTVSADNQVIIGDYFNGVVTKWNALTNDNLTKPFQINPIYLAMYVSFSIFIFVLDDFLRPWVRVLIVIFLVIFQLLLGSRIGLFSFVVTLMIFFFLNQKKYFAIWFVVAFLVLLISTICLNPVLKERYINDVISFTPPKDVSGWNAINIRYVIWDCSLESFSKSPIIGYGAGTQFLRREQCYANYSFYGPFGTDFNSHNQYLEYLLIGGIVLLMLFLSQLCYSFRAAFKSGSWLHLLFLVIFITTCLGESLLETHKGIVFFALFNSIFIFGNTYNDPK